MTTSSFFLFRTRTNEGRSSQHQPGQIYDLKIINRDEVAGLIASNVDNNRQVLTICSSLNSWILLNGKVIFRFKVDYRRRFFDNPDNMTRLFVRSASLGIKAVQLIGYQPLVVALMKAEKISGDFFVAVTIPRGDFASNLDLVSMLEPEFISVHAQFCDENDSRLSEWIDMIRDAGAKPAASTHSPGSTIPLLDEMGFEAYLAPVNTVGYGMEPDVESILKALERTKKAVIAIKPLAAGKLSPEKSVFKYIYSYADSIAVGITSEEEMEETYQLLLDADKKNIILVIIPALYDL